MREIKFRQYSNNQKKWQFLNLSKLNIVSSEKPNTVCEFINLVDQKGQDIYTGDIVWIENELIHKQFQVVFSQEKLGYCFQTQDQEEKPYSWQEIKGIFGNNFTITKTGNIFKQGG